MKTRQGFVSNSSSSSFAIERKCLSEKQIKLIRDHANSKEFKDDHYCSSDDEWVITLTKDCVVGSTFMDNFDMHWYLHEVVGVNPDDIDTALKNGLPFGEEVPTQKEYVDASLQRIIEWCKGVQQEITAGIVLTTILAELSTMYEVGYRNGYAAKCDDEEESIEEKERW